MKLNNKHNSIFSAKWNINGNTDVHVVDVEHHNVIYHPSKSLSQHMNIFCKLHLIIMNKKFLIVKCHTQFLCLFVCAFLHMILYHLICNAYRYSTLYTIKARTFCSCFTTIQNEKQCLCTHHLWRIVVPWQLPQRHQLFNFIPIFSLSFSLFVSFQNECVM